MRLICENGHIETEPYDTGDRCELCGGTFSEYPPSEAGAREATVSGPTLGSPERERGDQAGPESQQPCSPPEAGAESEEAAYKSALEDLFMAAEDLHDAWDKFLKAAASAEANKPLS